MGDIYVMGEPARASAHHVPGERGWSGREVEGGIKYYGGWRCTRICHEHLPFSTYLPFSSLYCSLMRPVTFKNLPEVVW